MQCQGRVVLVSVVDLDLQTSEIDIQLRKDAGLA